MRIPASDEPLYSSRALDRLLLIELSTATEFEGDAEIVF